MALQILEYFLRNENAADDLLGIAEFRLPEQILYQHLADVSDALEWLTARGLLTRTMTASTNPIFSLNRPQRVAAERFVARARARQ
jgi:hypothetical protein